MKLSNVDRIKLKEALELQKDDKDEEALTIIEDLLHNHSENSVLRGIYGLILGSKLELRKAAIPYLESAVLISNYEHFHLSLYISYVETEDYDKAFGLLFKYLDGNPACLFLDTLCELLEGLKYGYGINYKKDIIYYSLKNNVEVPSELLL